MVAPVDGVGANVLVAGTPHVRGAGHQQKVVRRRPTLPPSTPGSTIGADRLSFRVRNGAGRFPVAMVAVTLWRYPPASTPVPHWWRVGAGGFWPFLGNRI